MSKQANQRKGSVEVVASAAEAHAAKVSEAFGKIVGGHVEGKEKVPDLGLALQLVARALRAANERLLTADDAHQRELSDDAEPRERRDEAVTELIAEVVGIRSTIQAVFGPAGLRLVGLSGPTPTDAAAIEPHARRLLAALKDPDLTWPKPLKKGVKVDTSSWASDLEGPLETLSSSLRDVAREAREAQATLSAKNAALAHNDDLFARSATFISAALRLVGEDDLAARVRPSSRKPGSVQGDEADEGEGGQEGGK